MQIKVSYITANEIMEILGIGRSKAYDIVREMIKTDPSYGELLEKMVEGMARLKAAMTPYLTAKTAQTQDQPQDS